MGVHIRGATDDDWDEIWPFFRETVEARQTYALDPGMSPEEARGAWMARPPGRTSVAVLDGRVVGSARMGPNRPGPGAHVGTAGFMVARGLRGRGVGRALAEDAIAWHRASGFLAIQFNAVVETNTAAVRLWEQLGFRIVGTVPEAFDHAEKGLVGLHVMWLPLDEAPT